MTTTIWEFNEDDGAGSAGINERAAADWQQMSLPVSILPGCCEAHGLPVIMVQHHGFIFKVEPNYYESQKFEIVFWLCDKPVCRISMLGDVALVDQRRPANYLVECLRCFALVSTETNEQLGTVFWPA